MFVLPPQYGTPLVSLSLFFLVLFTSYLQIKKIHKTKQMEMRIKKKKKQMEMEGCVMCVKRKDGLISVRLYNDTDRYNIQFFIYSYIEKCSERKYIWETWLI